MTNLSGSSFIIVSIVIGQLVLASCQSLLAQALNENDLVKLQDTQRQERSCFIKLDSYLAKLWESELNNTDVNGSGITSEIWSHSELTNNKFNNTRTEEWLVNDEDPYWKLLLCSAGLFPSPGSVDKETENCTDQLFQKVSDRNEAEIDIHNALLNNTKDLPFRQFFSFSDLKDLLFQNRSVGNLTSQEQNVLDRMKSYVNSDEDEGERTWTLLQECNWEDLEELRNAKDDKHRFNLFKSQVIRSVDYTLGHRLVQNFDLSVNISHEDYTAWIKARENMLIEIDAIVGKLDSVKNDSRWICEYANEIANKFAQEQEAVLLSNTFYRINLKTERVVQRARAMARLESLNDTLRESFNDLADKFENRMSCWRLAVLGLENQQRYELTKHFISSNLSYSQIYCRQMNISLGLLAPHYCKCAGTFCVQHSIDALYAERFELTKSEKSGSYKVVAKNVNRPAKKVLAWPGVKEI